MTENELGNLFPFRDKLSKKQKDLLLSEIKHLTYTSQTRVYSYNSEFGCLYIKKGSVRVLIPGEKDTETEIFRYGKDEYVPMCLQEICKKETPDLAYIIASGSDVYALPSLQTRLLLESSPLFELFIGRLCLATYPNLINAIGQRDYFPLEKRICAFLIKESTRQKTNVIRITHAELASSIGSAREAVTRKLADFRNQGILRCERGKIIICNKEKLKKQG